MGFCRCALAVTPQVSATDAERASEEKRPGGRGHSTSKSRHLAMVGVARGVLKTAAAYTRWNFVIGHTPPTDQPPLNRTRAAGRR